MPHSCVVRQVDDVFLDLLSTMAVSSLMLRCATIPEFALTPRHSSVPAGSCSWSWWSWSLSPGGWSSWADIPAGRDDDTDCGCGLCSCPAASRRVRRRNDGSPRRRPADTACVASQRLVCTAPGRGTHTTPPCHPLSNSCGSAA
jgi:hypothetical protein